MSTVEDLPTLHSQLNSQLSVEIEHVVVLEEPKSFLLGHTSVEKTLPLQHAPPQSKVPNRR